MNTTLIPFSCINNRSVTQIGTLCTLALSWFCHANALTTLHVIVSPFSAKETSHGSRAQGDRSSVSRCPIGFVLALLLSHISQGHQGSGSQLQHCLDFNFKTFVGPYTPLSIGAWCSTWTRSGLANHLAFALGVLLG